jgi:hypothetical protein
MSKKKLNDEKEYEQVKRSVQFIIDTLDDEAFLQSIGQYIKFNDDFILPKYQDVLYSQTDKIETAKIIQDQVDYLSKGTEKVPKRVDGIFFLVPLSAVMALPPNYHANRVILKSDESLDYALSVTLVTGIQNNGTDNDGDNVISGIGFAVLGYRSPHIDDEADIGAIYSKCVDYLNDFITAYKLFRHDHTIHNVTIRTLPSSVEYYVRKGKKLSKKEYATSHANDLMDLWSKRLPDPQDLEHIKTLTELLPTEKSTHYILRIGEECISNICMAQYEDAIVNSDRFAELFLRDALRKELGLTADELSLYKELYSTKRPDKAVVQSLAVALNIKGDAVISKWYKHSRQIRNDITHKLELEAIDVNVALKAVECNMHLVDLVISKSDKDLRWYQIIPDSFSILFLSGKALSVKK